MGILPKKFSPFFHFETKNLFISFCPKTKHMPEGTVQSVQAGDPIR